VPNINIFLSLLEHVTSGFYEA